METIIKKGVYKILKVFYYSRNSAFHLRELARKTGLNENSISRFLNNLVEKGILVFEREGNLKKFSVNKKYLPIIFSIYDEEKLEKLPILRKNAIKNYFRKILIKPIFAVVFGSTAKENYKKDSDIDILLVVNSKTNNRKSIESVKSQTGIKIQEFQIIEEDFLKELKNKKENVIQSAIESGFPVFNNKYYWEVIYFG